MTRAGFLKAVGLGTLALKLRAAAIFKPRPCFEWVNGPTKTRPSLTYHSEFSEEGKILHFWEEPIICVVFGMVRETKTGAIIHWAKQYLAADAEGAIQKEIRRWPRSADWSMEWRDSTELAMTEWRLPRSNADFEAGLMTTRTL